GMGHPARWQAEGTNSLSNSDWVGDAASTARLASFRFRNFRFSLSHPNWRPYCCPDNPGQPIERYIVGPRAAINRWRGNYCPHH
ncbi:MAG: hypothetical protein WA177_09470, partial [Xanthobacteraceae bacterium]